MIPLQMPSWFDSIRSIIALILVVAVCAAVFVPKEYVNDTELQVLKDLAMLAVTFYFALKSRPEEKNGGSK